VRPAIDDPPAIEHDDLIGQRDGGEAVRDDERRPSLHRLPQPGLDLCLRPGVDG
jgi:hypothetical protein